MINIIGQILDSSGYSVHCRNLGRALGKLTDARYSIMAGSGWETQVDDKELEMIKEPAHDNEINLIITNPLYWRVNAQAKRNFVFLIWEGDKIPKCFLKECLNEEIEFIFVPSVHTKKAIEKTFNQEHIDGGLIHVLGEMPTKQLQKELLNKIKLIPHGVDTSLFYPKNKPDKCIFFANKGFRNLQDRGGIPYLLKAYFEEFTDKDNVELLLKINPAYGTENLQKMIDEIAPRKQGLPLLHINLDNIPYNKLIDLYNKCTVFVSPTRAESYNLPCIEAMACGLPVICTGYGGQTDFIKDKVNGLYIDYKLEEVKFEVQYEGISWATPSIKDLRKKLRYAFEHPEEMKKMGQEALKTARANSWENTAKKIISLI